MERPVYIYVLHDPTEVSQRVYVGLTLTPRRRLATHLQDARKGKKMIKSHWIRSLLARGVEPEMVILEAVPTGQDEAAERFWIEYFRAVGLVLANQTAGGVGARGYKAPPELRAHLSQIRKGRKMPRDGVLRGAEKLRGRRLAPKHIEKSAAAHRGKKKDADYKRKVTTARRGQKLRSDNSTGFKGIRLKAGKYDARLGRLYIGRFSTPEEAAHAYDQKARELWGEEAALNFPEDGEKGAR